MKNILFALLISLTALPARAAPAITRINAGKSLRCGYVEYEPALTRDLKTGAWRGFDYDIVQALADRLQIKAEFTAVSSWATLAADLNAGKFDMLCSGDWIDPSVSRFALFSRPIFFQPTFIVARTGDARFGDAADLNDPKLKMVALDGDNPVFIARSDFPRAQVLTLPNTTDFPQVLLNVAERKADFTIVDAYTFGLYNKNNPAKLKLVRPNHPVRIYPVAYAFGPEEGQLRDAVNTALDQLILDGTIDRILDKYDVFPNTYYRAAVTYRNPYKQGKH